MLFTVHNGLYKVYSRLLVAREHAAVITTVGLTLNAKQSRGGLNGRLEPTV